MSPEVSRKIINLVALLIPIVYYNLSKNDAILLLGVVTIGFVVVDALRLRIGPFKTLFIIVFGSMLRKKELKGFTGATYLMIGALLSALFFTKYIFITALSFAIVGDTFAAITGQVVGKIKIGRKTLEGSIAGLISCIIVVFVVSKLANHEFPIIIGIIGAVVASIVEMLPIDLNDNVVIPLASGAVMELWRIIFK